MALKDDIYKAFEKNLGKEYVDATEDGKKKLDTLSVDLTKARRGNTVITKSTI